MEQPKISKEPKKCSNIVFNPEKIIHLDCKSGSLPWCSE